MKATNRFRFEINRSLLEIGYSAKLFSASLFVISAKSSSIDVHPRTLLGWRELRREPKRVLTLLAREEDV